MTLQESVLDNWPLTVVRGDEDPLKSLLFTLISPYERVERDVKRLRDERLVKYASGAWLEYLGGELGVEKQSGESEAHYRKRVQVRNIVAGTPCSMRGFGEVVLEALETTPNNVVVFRDHSTQLGAVIVETSNQVVSNAEMTATEIEAELERAVQADRRVVLNVLGSAEYDDTKKGFGKTYSSSL